MSIVKLRHAKNNYLTFTRVFRNSITHSKLNETLKKFDREIQLLHPFLMGVTVSYFANFCSMAQTVPKKRRGNS
jgi:hypothetical protein